MEELDSYLFHQGTSYNSYNFMGVHFATQNGEDGAVFRVWAYNASAVWVVGDFNGWNKTEACKMKRITEQGIWEAFIPKTQKFDNYKFLIQTKDGRLLYKSDPYAFHSETDGKTASKVYSIEGTYNWNDADYIAYRAKINIYESPVNIYEIHAGSWKKYPDGNRYDYRKLADELLPYLKEMGYTHVELMPIMEHPFDGSWGYQITGYYSPTSRFGVPEDFMYFVDKMHSEGIGVILDWVPGHFPKDENGLVEFDGGYLYECQDSSRMEHKGWGTRVFDFGRNEVQSFLISNAVFWFDKYHIDGLRADAVASMIYLDYDRKPDEWRCNQYGGKENIEALEFLKKLNTEVFARYPYALMIAEESTAFGGVTRPVNMGGLGFNFKWNMGWMNDIFRYISTDPIYRCGIHDKLTFSLFYAFSENFILPISHDEVVHGKRSLIDKMWGGYNEKFAGMRAFYAYMIAHPGKKLLFMGCEFAQFKEWDYREGLEFFLLDYEAHYKMRQFVRELNNFYLQHSEFYEIDYDWRGFKWLVCDDKDSDTAVFERYSKDGSKIVAAFNFSGITITDYRVPCQEGIYSEALNTDGRHFGGSGMNNGVICSQKDENGVFIKITLPALSAVYFTYKKDKILKIE
jgi:1,4-alpha-glucan branching enzyme